MQVIIIRNAKTETIMTIKGGKDMFSNVSKIVLPKKEEHADLVKVVTLRTQCRTTHKRKDC